MYVYTVCVVFVEYLYMMFKKYEAQNVNVSDHEKIYL